MVMPHIQTKEMTLNNEAKSKFLQKWPSLPFVWNPAQLQKYQDMPPCAEFSTVDLDFDNFGPSLTS